MLTKKIVYSCLAKEVNSIMGEYIYEDNINNNASDYLEPDRYDEEGIASYE